MSQHPSLFLRMLVLLKWQEQSSKELVRTNMLDSRLGRTF